MAELYAIVGTVRRALFMLKADVPYLQLRLKDTPLAPYRGEIAQWPHEFPNTRIIINDDLEFADSVNAWGVHLGQEDLRRYSPESLLGTRLNLGISTHSDEEIEIARQFSAAMIGFGPMFDTDTKKITHSPQGVARLTQVVASCGMPVVAIGGIGDQNMDEVVKSGVAMVAMIAYLDRLETVEDVHKLMHRLRG